MVNGEMEGTVYSKEGNEGKVERQREREVRCRDRGNGR